MVKVFGVYGSKEEAIRAREIVMATQDAILRIHGVPHRFKEVAIETEMGYEGREFKEVAWRVWLHS